MVKILDIRFKNLNSLVGEWQIDLTNPAFVEDGIFVITGPTGAGKSYLACALGNKACREGYRVLYFRVSRLFQELAIADGERLADVGDPLTSDL